MAAANTDKLRKKKNLFSTTLNGGIASDTTTLTCNSLTGVPTDTAVTVTIDRVDANSVSTPTLREDVTGVVSGSNITDLLRGEGATTAQSHSNGAIVEITWETETWNDAVDAILVGHTQAGAHIASLPLTTPKITTSINDANGNEVIKTPATSSAVNEITVTNAAANGSPSITATGGDTNIDLLLAGKGTGVVIPQIPLAEGQMINGKIVPSVASNNLTVALKTMAGDDPSVATPVYVRIGSVIRSITSALSCTKNAGTAYMSMGSAELATKEVDLFAHIVWVATASECRLCFSRLPYSNLVSDYDGYTTTEKSLMIDSTTSLAVTDQLVVIGRFAATLSAGAGYTWSVPTFTATNLIQERIFEKRNSNANFTVDGAGSLGTFTRNVFSSRYKIVGDEMHVQFYADITNKGSWSGAFQVNFPFSAAGLYTLFGIVSAQNVAANYLNSNCYGPIQINTNSLAQFEKGIGNSL